MELFLSWFKKHSFVSILVSIYFFAFVATISVFAIRFLASDLLKKDRKDLFVKNIMQQMKADENRGLEYKNEYGDADRKKLVQIKQSFLHLWNNYKALAWGHDVISEDDKYADYSGYAP